MKTFLSWIDAIVYVLLFLPMAVAVICYILFDKSVQKKKESGKDIDWRVLKKGE